MLKDLAESWHLVIGVQDDDGVQLSGGKSRVVLIALDDLDVTQMRVGHAPLQSLHLGVGDVDCEYMTVLADDRSHPQRQKAITRAHVGHRTAGADARRCEDLVDVLPLLARPFSGDALGTDRNNSQQPDRNQTAEHHLFHLATDPPRILAPCARRAPHLGKRTRPNTRVSRVRISASIRSLDDCGA